ncbi:hypothetical protein [Anaerotignum sp.]|uniref:hypothetical protein n=1 Tax=Anaerotignum sp. TaxID=2039241 RepID=UPI002896EF96|nr:hypothetical protein [Anaerotignum sp.]
MKTSNKDLMNIVVAQNTLIAEQAEQLAEVTYTPPVITDGVLVKMARFTIPFEKKETKPMKWYEDKLKVC